MVVREEWNVGGPIHALVEIRSERSFLVLSEAVHPTFVDDHHSVGW